jgi:excisionase family DNA binding protein
MVSNEANAAGELWDAKDVARYLKVSRSWVYHRAEAGFLPSLRVGGLVRFEPALVRAFAQGDVQAFKGLSFRRDSPRKRGEPRGG